MLPLAVLALLVPAPVYSPWLNDHAPMDVRFRIPATGVEVWAEALRQQGYQSGLADQPAEALPALNASILLYPHDADIYGGRGRVLSKLGRHDDAADDFAHMIARTPHDWTNWQRVARGWMTRGKPDEAQKCFDRAAALCPPGALRAGARMAEAACWLELPVGYQRKANGQWWAPINVPPDAAMNAGPTGRSRADMAVTLALNEDGDAQTDVRAGGFAVRGLIRLTTRKCDEAAAAFDAALSYLPTDPRLHLLRVQTALELRDCDALERHLSLAERNGCEPRWVAFVRFQMHSQQGESAKAEPFAAELCRLEPDNVDAHRQHALTLRMLGKEDAADTATGRAAKLGGVSAAFLDMMAAVLLCEQKQHAAALRLFDRILDRPGLSVHEYQTVLGNRGNVRRNLGDADAAFDDLTLAAHLAPGDSNCHRYRAMAALTLNRRADAMYDADALLRLEPWNEEAGRQRWHLRSAEELTAGMAGRAPDFRPPGPFEPVPIRVRFAERFLGDLTRRRTVGFGP